MWVLCVYSQKSHNWFSKLGESCTLHTVRMTNTEARYCLGSFSQIRAHALPRAGSLSGLEEPGARTVLGLFPQFPAPLLLAKTKTACWEGVDGLGSGWLLGCCAAVAGAARTGLAGGGLSGGVCFPVRLLLRGLPGHRRHRELFLSAGLPRKPLCCCLLSSNLEVASPAPGRLSCDPGAPVPGKLEGRKGPKERGTPGPSPPS